MNMSEHVLVEHLPDQLSPRCEFAPDNTCRHRQAEGRQQQPDDEHETREQQRTGELSELNEKLIHEMNARSIVEEELHRVRQILHMVLDVIPQRVFWKDRDSRYLGCNRSFADHAGLNDPKDVIGMDDNQMPWGKESEYFQAADRMVMEYDTPMRNYDVAQPSSDGQISWHRKSRLPLYNRNGAVIGILGTFEDITESMRIKDLLIKNGHILAEAQAIANLGSWEYCLETKKEYRSAEFFRILGYQDRASGFAENSMFDHIHPQDQERVRQSIIATLENGKPYDIEYRIIRVDGQERFVHAKGKTIREKNDKTTRFIGAIQDITERKNAEERKKTQWKQLAALRAIDMAITESLDLRVTLNVVLDQVVHQLGADAADILLLNHAHKLEHAASRGFRNNSIKRCAIPFGKGNAGRVAYERRIIHISNVQLLDNCRYFPNLSDEGYISYFGAPLVAKGEVVGVLEVFYRSSHSLDQEMLDFLETLAGQAAIAIDNATLFSGLQRSNISLMMAYDSTLEGWSRALDLRDRETEGHSQRVTDMTEKIAQALGVPKDELIHIRRGAMLHDIGKMGVPDQILLKPGPLSDEERGAMQQHPVHAFNLLAPIAFLRPALDIPYCHHEKWDGSGYPRGLKGRQIPLGARIFAVIDVWDALRSDRPYRPAWSKEKTTEYIIQQSGTHFDPEVVTLFMSQIEKLDDDRNPDHHG
ncbi:MAG: PAS domain-containing protein [Desulfuromonadales bacterium]|nr:PAS domain-containing protein [Desulfuromonadales bacterium]